MGDHALEAARCMRDALNEVLDGLTRQQREQAYIAHTDHAERANWAYFPRLERGLALAELNHRQRKLVHRLLRSALSFEAYTRATTIMSIENVLDEIERRRSVHVRDEALYYLSVFTDLGQVFNQPIGWRLQGHHISVNFLFDGDRIAASSPLFLGSNPARVVHDGYDLVRPLGDTEDRARELLDALTPQQRTKAVVFPSAPPDFVLGILPLPTTVHTAATIPGVANILEQYGGAGALEAMRFDPRRPMGIAAEELSSGQRELFARLLALYTGRFAEGAAWDGIGSLDQLHFAWAGSLDVGQGHYYRLQGPNIVVEYDNVQNHANHVHTVTRHPSNDFGADALGLHHLWEHSPWD